MKRLALLTRMAKRMTRAADLVAFSCDSLGREGKGRNREERGSNVWPIFAPNVNVSALAMFDF